MSAGPDLTPSEDRVDWDARLNVPWLPGDPLIRILPAGWGVDTGWTMIGENTSHGLMVWRTATEIGGPDPDVYVMVAANGGPMVTIGEG